MFHSQASLNKLRVDSRHRVLGFETGHWVQVEQPEAVNAAIIAWLGDRQSDKAA